jgi:hypothetical protein
MRAAAGLLTLLLAAALFGPAVAADNTHMPTPPADAAAPAGDATPPAADDQSGGGGDAAPDASAPAADAPVPDPFLAEVLKTCRDGASGDKGTFQRLQDAGWGLTVDGDTQTPFYQAFNGEKDFDGVGTVDITYSLEVYPSLTEGYCSLSIDTATRKIGVADLAKMADLKGELRKTDDGLSSNWQDNVADPQTFVQADFHDKTKYFLLDVTTLMKKPAADIPFVAPDPGDPGADENDNSTDNTALPDSTNAAN